MNKILLEIKKIMIDCIEKYIPDISFDDLEDNGAVKTTLYNSGATLIYVYGELWYDKE